MFTDSEVVQYLKILLLFSYLILFYKRRRRAEYNTVC